MEPNRCISKSIISVIVPAHNLSKYIGICLDSLLAQSFEDFEIICIDDSSSDNTYTELKRYSEKDERITVLRLGINCGASFTRNFGVEHAHGELITFVDGDDFVSPFYLENLYRAWSSTAHHNTLVKARNVRGAYETLNQVQWLPYADEKTRVLTSEEAVREFLLERMTVVAWACLAPRKLYLEHPFPIGMLFEDHYIMAEHLESVENVVIMDVPIYAYVTRLASLSNPIKHDARYVSDMTTVVGHFLELFQNKKDELQGPLAWACAWRLALAISYCADVENKAEVSDNYRLATRYLRNNLPTIIRTWHVEKMDSGQMRKILVAASSPRLYWRTRGLFRLLTGADRH